jgi:hypothetical protein
MSNNGKAIDLRKFRASGSAEIRKTFFTLCDRLMYERRKHAPDMKGVINKSEVQCNRYRRGISMPDEANRNIIAKWLGYKGESKELFTKLK